jgi:hypothetical protein
VLTSAARKDCIVFDPASDDLIHIVKGIRKPETAVSLSIPLSSAEDSIGTPVAFTSKTEED